MKEEIFSKTRSLYSLAARYRRRKKIILQEAIKTLTFDVWISPFEMHSFGLLRKYISFTVFGCVFFPSESAFWKKFPQEQIHFDKQESTFGQNSAPGQLGRGIALGASGQHKVVTWEEGEISRVKETMIKISEFQRVCCERGFKDITYTSITLIHLLNWKQTRWVSGTNATALV